MGYIIIGDIVCSVEWLLNQSFDLIQYPMTDNFIIEIQ